MRVRDVDTPLGVLRLTQEGEYLCAACFTDEPVQRSDASPLLDEAECQLRAYFAGQLTVFNLSLYIGGTAFEQEVMHALLEIPHGQTRSYGQIARQIGREKAVRAVGRACSRNRLLVFIPCHRVIAGNGKLTGFAAGIKRKQALLSLEGVRINT